MGAHLASSCRLSCTTDVKVVLLPAVQVVYLPSCVTRMMGPSRGDPESEPVHDKLLSLFGKANYEVIYPEVRGWWHELHCSCQPLLHWHTVKLVPLFEGYAACCLAVAVCMSTNAPQMHLTS
jgi:hypothetical protein